MKTNVRTGGGGHSLTNRAFTLIELLAVIVILAIIALIAVPIILNIIEDAKVESNQRSVELYADAVKNSVAQYQLEKNEAIIGAFSTDNGRDFKHTNFKVEYDGNVVCEKIEIYENGNVYLDKCKVNGSKKEYTYGIDMSYDNGKIVYLNILTGKSCLDYHEDNSIIEYNGLEETMTTENQNACLKFYVFNDDCKDTVNLLLDHNTTKNSYWTNSSVSTNEKGPIIALKELYNDTKEWNVPNISKKYTMNQVGQVSNANYTIDYSGYKARLITAQEIAQITGADKEDTLNWKEESSTGGYYLDGAKGKSINWQTQVANSTNKSDYYWLYDRTNSCSSWGCNVADEATNGYWTSSSHASITNKAWIINYFGKISTGAYVFDGTVNHTGIIGIRPVIEVKKSNLS